MQVASTFELEIDRTDWSFMKINQSIKKWLRFADERLDFVVAAHKYLSFISACIQQKSCETCQNVGNFNCAWCKTLQQCSDGNDRKREAWIASKCKVTVSVLQ
jgi:hypothetical protein